MNKEEITRVAQLAYTNAVPGTPRGFAYNEMLSILQRPGISIWTMEKLLTEQRTKYRMMAEDRDLPQDDRRYWWEVYESMVLIGTWIDSAKQYESHLYGEL